MSAQPRWDDTAPAQRPVAVPTSGAVAERDRNAARIVSVIALASIAAGAINIAAAATIGGNNAQTHLFFAAVGAAQVVWGLLALVWAPRWWLVLGALGNAVVVATWLVSRTVGLPFGQFAHVVLPVRFPDSVATILAAVTVVGAVVLVVRGSGYGAGRSTCAEFRARGRGGDRGARPRRRLVADQRVRVRGRRRRPERPDRALRWETVVAEVRPAATATDGDRRSTGDTHARRPAVLRPVAARARVEGLPAIAFRYGHGGESAPHSTWSSSAATAVTRSARGVNDRPPPGANDGMTSAVTVER